ncbi:putative receptor protein kinase ZmPK1 [Morella rubra]|uniref:non-specific serine/threonine protein kinase n=1 Tax=Morella rubra TaxID=262757 RepID=A0A6A1WRI3_9ROSI|nr:putative receptor protein kinase ZmPK1 [Morella rubra]
MANRDDPVGRGSQISILKDGKLSLTNSMGTTVWTAKTVALMSLEASQLQLQLLDTGNLILHHSENDFIRWQSFDSPTDTLLPQQTLTRISSLISKSSEADYSSGYYKLYFDNDNVLRLIYQSSATSSLYWPYPWLIDYPGQDGRSRSNTSRTAGLNASGYFWSSDNFQFHAADFGVLSQRRLTLDPDGNLRLYSLQEMEEGWERVVTRQAFSEPCMVHGLCGPNSLCSYDNPNSLCSYDNASGRRCSCLQGFKIKDPTDWSQGCEPEFTLLQSEKPDAKPMLECPLKAPQQLRQTYENQTVKLLLSFATALGGVEVARIFVVFFLLRRTSKRSDPAAQGYLLTTRFKRFTFSELRKAAQGFNEVIGRGAGGTVYKGVLPDQKVVAIKQLNEAIQGEAEFLAEVNTIGKLNHMNLIDIWGYCAEGKHRLLVYDYMEHGSLAENLMSSDALDWKKRFDIAVGTAKGLAYLHEECLEWVLHCDVKPQNILLDSNYRPKVADFGLSKLLNRRERDHSNFSKMRGTRGYMAPEWVYNLPITSKVDVYSYGIVVLEMVTGMSPAPAHGSNSTAGGAREHRRLVTLMREKINNIGSVARKTWMDEIIDTGMAGNYDVAKMEVLVRVGLQCVAENKDDRPTMSQVVEMLLVDEVN